MAVSFSAHAFCFAPGLKVSDEFYVSPLVIRATVLSARDVLDAQDQDSINGTFYRLHIDQTFRGSSPAAIEVYSENSTGRFPMLPHRSYVLFLSRSVDRHWFVDNCGNSGLLPSKAATLHSISELPLKQSFIYGEVYPFSGPMQCPPMTLTVQGSAFTRTTTISSDCTFHMNVDPGTFSATLTWHGRRVPSYDLPYKDPYCFEVPKGGSAGIAFRPEDGADKLNLDALAISDRHLRLRCKEGPQNKPELP